MGQTMSNFDAVLKVCYAGAVVDALPDKVELYDYFKKDGDSWDGKKVVEPIRIARNYGVGSRADGGTMPTAQNQGWQEHLITAKYNYGRINVTEPVIAASRSQKGSFEKAVASEMKYMILDITNNIDRQMYGDGSGSIGVIETGANATTQEIKYAGASSGAISGEPGSRFIKKGMLLNIGTAAEHAAGSCVNTTVSSVTDRDTIEVTQVTTVTDDIIVLGDAVTLVNSTYGGDIQGLDTAFITTGTYQNIIVDNYPDWKANILSNSGTNRTLTEDLCQQAIDEAEENGGGSIDLIVAHLSMRREFLSLLAGDKRYMGANLQGGAKSITFAVGGKDYNIKFTRQCQYNRIYFLDSTTWTYYPQFTGWMDKDGAILSRVSNAAAYEALYELYANLGCSKPNANTVLKDITVTLRAT